MVKLAWVPEALRKFDYHMHSDGYALSELRLSGVSESHIVHLYGLDPLDPTPYTQGVDEVLGNSLLVDELVHHPPFYELRVESLCMYMSGPDQNLHLAMRRFRLHPDVRERVTSSQNVEHSRISENLYYLPFLLRGCLQEVPGPHVADGPRKDFLAYRPSMQEGIQQLLRLLDEDEAQRS